MIYTLFFIFLVIGSFMFVGTSGRKVYLFLIMFFLFLIIGLRDTTVGADTLSYVEGFNRISKKSFSEMLFHAFRSSEPLFIIISWLPSTFSLNYTLYLFTWALFPVCSLYVVFKTELLDSKDYLIAIVVFFLLGLYAFYVAGIRQTAALSILMPAAINMSRSFSQNNRFYWRLRVVMRYLLMVGIAYLIHNSSILALLVIPCLFIRMRWWYILIILALFALGNTLNVDNIVIFSEYIFNDRFANYGTVYQSSQNISAFIMQMILFLICISVKDRLVKRDSQNNFYLTVMLLGLMVQSLSSMMAEMARVSFYFSVFGIILVPKAIRELSGKKNMAVIYYLFVILSIVYLFFLTSSNLPEYVSII